MDVGAAVVGRDGADIRKEHVLRRHRLRWRNRLDFSAIFEYIGKENVKIAKSKNRFQRSFPFQRDFHESAPFVLIAGMSIVAAFASMFSPETKDRPMPEDLSQFDPGPVYNYLFGSKPDAQPITARYQKPIDREVPFLNSYFNQI